MRLWGNHSVVHPMIGGPGWRVMKAVFRTALRVESTTSPTPSRTILFWNL